MMTTLGVRVRHQRADQLYRLHASFVVENARMPARPGLSARKWQYQGRKCKFKDDLHRKTTLQTQQEKRPAHVGRAIPVKQSHRRKDFKR